MSFLPVSNITIGPYVRVKVNHCKITRSMFSYVDKAVIKIPITARIKRADQTITATAETAKVIEEGMKVEIRLGYNGQLNTEFIGFVSRINFTMPCEIECEGFSYILRKKSYLKVFKNTTLKEILQFLVDRTEITLSPLIPDLKISKWVINQKSGTEVLEDLKKEMRIAIFFTGSELYAGLQYLQPKATTKYRLGWNTIKDGNLKLREAKNQEIIIKIQGKKQDGTKVNVVVGDKGEIKQIDTHAVTDEATLKAIAEAEKKRISYDGYEGKITAFLLPYCEPGYAAQIIDRKYPERGGKYIIESVEVEYGINGGRRIVDIGFKLND